MPSRPTLKSNCESVVSLGWPLEARSSWQWRSRWPEAMKLSSCQIQSTDFPCQIWPPPAESSIGDACGAALDLQMDLNSSCEFIALYAPASEKSTGKDNPQALAWAKRIHVGRTPLKRPLCDGRVYALEKSFREFAKEEQR